VAMNLSVAISGSFRKHLSELKFVISKFESEGIKVLCPLTTNTIDPKAEFIVLTSDDPSLSNSKLEMNYMRKIGSSDFHYIYNLNGYIGYSVAAEIAYARLKGISIIMSEEIKNFSTDIPVESHKILMSIGKNIVHVDDISIDSVQGCRNKILNKEDYISKNDYLILSNLIKALIKNLASLNRENEL